MRACPMLRLSAHIDGVLLNRIQNIQREIRIPTVGLRNGKFIVKGGKNCSFAAFRALNADGKFIRITTATIDATITPAI